MSRTKLVPATLDHLLELRGYVSGSITVNTGFDIYKTLLQHPAFALLSEEGVVGAGGVVRLWPGVGEGWAIINPLLARKHARMFHRTAKRLRETIMDAHDLHRIQTNVVASFKAGRRWAEAMGCQSEGVARQGGPNREDLIRYAYVRS